MASDILATSDNWVNICSVASGIAFVIISPILRKLKRKIVNSAPTTSQNSNLMRPKESDHRIWRDMTLGVTLLPSALMIAYPILPNLGKYVISANPVLISISFAATVAILLNDWWRGL